MTSVVYKRSLRAVTRNAECTSCSVNILFIASIFTIKSKKNNQSSVFDADKEIPTLRSMDNAGNSVTLVWNKNQCFLVIRTKTMFDMNCLNRFFWA